MDCQLFADFFDQLQRQLSDFTLESKRQCRLQHIHIDHRFYAASTANAARAQSWDLIFVALKSTSMIFAWLDGRSTPGALTTVVSGFKVANMARLRSTPS